MDLNPAFTSRKCGKRKNADFQDVWGYSDGTKPCVPTLQAIQKLVEVYLFKGIYMLKQGYILPNLARFCLQKSSRAKLTVN